MRTVRKYPIVSALWAVLAALVVVYFAFPGSGLRPSGNDPQGCHGFTAYTAAMNAARDGISQLETLQGIASPTAFDLTSDDWQAIADELGRYLERIKAINPPSYAADWHASFVHMLGVIQQSFLAAKSGGYFAMVVYFDAQRKTESDLEAQLAAPGTCETFATFASDYFVSGP